MKGGGKGRGKGGKGKGEGGVFVKGYSILSFNFLLKQISHFIAP